MRTLIVDNYDSFTFNLFQALASVTGCDPIVVRNDQLTLADVRELGVDNIVISPGPGRSERAADFGICAELLRHADVPVLGVCLGCQGLGSVYGARVVKAVEPMHGRTSRIEHDDPDLFVGVEQGFTAVRYHSLRVAEPLPACLRRIAWTADGVVMGIRHRELPLWGLQFHPESIGTEHGLTILKNFCRTTERVRALHSAPYRAPRVASPLSVVPHGEAQPQAAEGGATVRWRQLPLRCTAEDLFCGLFAQQSYAAWLDSSLTSPDGARFSFMGVPDGPRDVWRYDVGSRRLRAADGTDLGEGPVDFFAALREQLRARATAVAQLPFDFQGGAVGYLGYEMKAACGFGSAHAAPHPDAVLLWLNRFLAIDHAATALYLVCVEPPGDGEAADQWLEAMARRVAAVGDAPAVGVAATTQAAAPRAVASLSRTVAQYRADVVECQRLIGEGESYEICLTDNLNVDAQIDPVRLHRVLRRRNPAPYAALLRVADFAVVSSSPERFLRIDRARSVEAKPIKGTMRRGATGAEDAALREALRQSEKNRAENMMIVDLMRNDLGTVCEPGSIVASALMDVETYATVHQMVSTIRGRLRADVDAVECVRQAFPAGSMTGAPKRRTMEILDRMERQARGVYSGVLGHFGFNGTVDLSVVIRAAVVEQDRVTVGAGGAVVALSHADEEIAELRLKAEVMLDAIGETMHA